MNKSELETTLKTLRVAISGQRKRIDQLENQVKRKQDYIEALEKRLRREADDGK